jgi:hypothetical protein
MTDRIGRPPADAMTTNAMTTGTVHDNHELFVSYVYGECEAQERAQLEAHLLECTACAAELEALGGTRRELAAWAPPDVALGFQITRPQRVAARAEHGQADTAPAAHAAVVLKPARWWSRPMPAWAQAAAAMLVFGAGLSLGGNVNPSRTEVGPESDATAAVMDVARQREVATATTDARRDRAATAVPNSSAERELVAEVGRLRAELAELRQARTVSASAAVSPAPRTSDQDALIERVRALIDESEQRQRTEFTLRSAQLVRDVELQRRADLTRVERTIGLVQGQTGAEVRQNREALNYLGRVVATTNGNK